MHQHRLTLGLPSRGDGANAGWLADRWVSLTEITSPGRSKRASRKKKDWLTNSIISLKHLPFWGNVWVRWGSAHVVFSLKAIKHTYHCLAWQLVSSNEAMAQESCHHISHKKLLWALHLCVGSARDHPAASHMPVRNYRHVRCDTERGLFV